MKLLVLGPMVVPGYDPLPAPRDRVVLSALTVRCGTVLTAGEIADVPWLDQRLRDTERRRSDVDCSDLVRQRPRP